MKQLNQAIDLLDTVFYCIAPQTPEENTSSDAHVQSSGSC